MGTVRTIAAGDGRDVRSWASIVEQNTLDQAVRTARSSAVSGSVALMPDAHVGIGATVGSVIPTEAAILPAAVGVDLGCGMSAVRVGHTASHLPDDLGASLVGIAGAVPSGFEAHPRPTAEAEAWLRAHPLPDPARAPRKAGRRMGAQLGTLGGGNHFVEMSLDESERVWVVLHSGSRGVGNVLATSHIREAKRACKEAGRELEDPDLAYFEESDDGFAPYVADMLWAQDYALCNRSLMMSAVLGALRAATGLSFTVAERVSCHHNYASRERHGGRTMWITRKGAIRAGAGERGVIPGSMGDDTYIVTGKGNPDSYRSAAHGAGRRMSRREARQKLNAEELAASTSGRAWQAGSAAKLLDEAPAAYKPIAAVMSDQADLVSIDHRLRAVLNYKGC